jgi:hypothetical protein
MRKLRLIGLIFVTAIACVIISIKTQPSLATQPTIKLETEPPINNIIPAQEPVNIKLQAVNGDGQALTNTKIKLRLLTPPKTPWFTSDFPIVEGTTLLELEANAPSGELQFEKILPIRGNYQLIAEVTPQIAGKFQPFEELLTISVPENPVKYINLGILLTILLLVGLAGGWIIGGKQNIRVGEIAPQPVRLLLSSAILVAIAVLLYVNISSELIITHDHNHSHSHDKEIATSTPSAINKTANLDLRLTGDDHAIVGQLMTQTVEISNPQTAQPVTDVKLKIQAIALEHNEVVFVYQGSPDATGKFTWKEQFFDGAPHQIVAEIVPLNNSQETVQPLQVVKEIEVQAIAPPLSVRFISLIYFTVTFVLGLLAGLWLRNSRIQFVVRSS